MVTVTLQSHNPASGEVIWEGKISLEREIQDQIERGSKALIHWRKTPLEERIRTLYQYQTTLKNNADALALAISKETGKPLLESQAEVASMVGKIPISIQAYEERCHKKTTSFGPYTLKTDFRPHGLVVCLGPFNFPGHLPNGHIVPALIAGNVVLFKPSEFTPYVGELMGKYGEESGFPEGIFQVVQGGAETGKILTDHQEIRGIFFTGSAKVGELLKQHHSKRILALEMGGNNPLVISKIEDIVAAAKGTIQSAFLTTGQRCSAARRLILTPDCPDSFIPELLDQIQKLKIDAYDQEPFMGPLIHQKAAETLLEAQKNMISEGGKPLYPVKKIKPGLPFVTPGLIDTTGVKVPDEEYFGPLLQLIYASSFEEALLISNDTEYGLSAALYSESEEEWEQFYTEIRAGIINWNHPTTGASSKGPFGGIGKSGNYHPSGYLAADYCSYPVASLYANLS